MMNKLIEYLCTVIKEANDFELTILQLLRFCITYILIIYCVILIYCDYSGILTYICCSIHWDIAFLFVSCTLNFLLNFVITKSLQAG